MKRTHLFYLAIALFISSVTPTLAEDVSVSPAPANASEPILLWPAVAPGDKGDLPEEHDETKHDPNAAPRTEVIRLGNVSKPTITLYRPAKELDTHAAVIVCPGGGYHILALDLEGTEVCEWLNSIGVTGILLKYRVPGRGGERYTASLQDAQRAIGLVRSRASEWDLDPQRIGILGFSAGGHLAATASNTVDARTYPLVDESDKASCRPDFTILIYPAYLAANNTDVTKLAPEIKVTAKTPPAFVTITQDDPVHVENAFAYGLALKNAGVPAEVHVYPIGGHGYGLRPSPNEVSHWPKRAEEWMKSQGLLKGK